MCSNYCLAYPTGSLPCVYFITMAMPVCAILRWVGGLSKFPTITLKSFAQLVGMIWIYWTHVLWLCFLLSTSPGGWRLFSTVPHSTPTSQIQQTPTKAGMCCLLFFQQPTGSPNEAISATRENSDFHSTGPFLPKQHYNLSTRFECKNDGLALLGPTTVICYPRRLIKSGHLFVALKATSHLLPDQ